MLYYKTMSIENSGQTPPEPSFQPLQIETGHPFGLEAAIRDRIESNARIAALETRVTRDPLTGALNRLGFEEQLERVAVYDGAEPIEERRHSQSGSALLFIDLDGFKQANDTYGHPKGDEILISCTQLLKNKIRPTDSVGRLGGDELAVLMTEINGDADSEEVAAKAAEEIRRDIEQAFKDQGVTASIGVLGNLARVTPEEAVAMADASMYEAKKRKNEVVTHSQYFARTNALPISSTLDT
jgi:diguanylate cyclase (GGDEF)-like protein